MTLANKIVANTDKIIISRLRIQTNIGIYDWEKKNEQEVYVSLKIICNCKSAAISDCIDDALDYDELSKRIIHFTKNSSFNLIESLAENIAMIALKYSKVKEITVTVEKPRAITLANNVAVEITRSPSDV